MNCKNLVLGVHSFVFDPKNNGGEAFTLTTKFIGNGDVGGVYMNQELTLQSHCNSASFLLSGTTLTPENLRKLANELESAMIIAKSKTAA